MNTGGKKITYTKKVVVTIYRSACEHPFILGLVFFLLLLYRFLPFLFAFLVSSSPIIICTALLLGTLLYFGEPNISEIEEDETSCDLSLPCMHNINNDLAMVEDESSSIESHVENVKKDAETVKKEAKVFKQVDHVRKSERGVFLSANNEEEEKKAEGTIVTGLSLEVDIECIQIDRIVANKDVANDRKHLKKEELREGEFLDDTKKLGRDVHLATNGQNESEGLKVEISEPEVDRHFDSSLDSSLKLINSHDASGSDSDHAESSSPDASVAAIIPVLDELHPLLDGENPQPVTAPVDDLHSMSGVSTEDGESDDCNGEEEAENQEEDGEEEEEEETKEEKEDGAALAVKWTEDDEKNLRVLGTSELERNQRLENLIAKRIERKNLRIQAEKNLIDLDGNETVSIMDQLSRLQVQVPPISMARQNPFDLPYGSEESAGLPPIPGSAPSVLLPRRNPFDLPHFQPDENDSLTGMSQSHQAFFIVPQREILFRRHESFAHGASFTGDSRQERHNIKFRPYFVTERTNLEETSDTYFQRQLSEKSDSKGSSIPESESASSVAVEDCNCELSEQQWHQESDFELISSSINKTKLVGREMSSLDEVDSVDPLSRHKGIKVGTSHEVYVGTSEGSGVDIQEATNDFARLNRHDLDLCSPMLDATGSDVTEGTYTTSSPSGSSEISGEKFSTKTGEASIDLQQPSGDSTEDPIVSMRPVRGQTDVVNDSHVVEPDYDSSPSTAEKSCASSSSLEEELPLGGEGSFKSTSSLSSEALSESSEMGSPSMLAERNIFSRVGIGGIGSISASDNGEFWVAAPNLFSVEENESRSREVYEIFEQDVIQVEISEVIEQIVHQIQ